MIETTCEIGDKTSVESSYFIASSGIKTVGYFAQAVRAHWGVESMHWTLDVTYWKMPAVCAKTMRSVIWPLYARSC